MAKLCTIQDCGKPHLAKGMCQKHYYRAKRGQSITGKSRFDRRPARVEGELAYIELANNKGEAIIDAINKDLDKYNWSLSGDGYPMTYIKGKYVKMHHLVIGKPKKGLVTDHRNRDKLDNRKDNLRSVTQYENMLNGALSYKLQTA